MALNPLNTYIDNTLLKPQSTLTDVESFVKDSLHYDFAGLCIPPSCVDLVSEMIEGRQETKLVTVIGFPLGYQKSNIKFAEANQAIQDGADELDMVLNISAFKSAKFEKVKSEISEIASLCHEHDRLLKLIIEVALLSVDETKHACQLGAEANVDFIKTSTGFAAKKKELTPAFIRSLRSYIPGSIQIKASGGVRDAAHATALIQAGADRIGTSSGISLMENRG
jgi:deoxyribose-phosphate aldolase